MMRHKGVICGILAAVCYGTNPFGALPLYEEGVNTSSVLFYRFSMAVVMLGVMLLAERKSFRINRQELKVLGGLGILFAASCLTYYESFLLMDAGIASTILFVYPVMVAGIMGALEPLTAVAIGVLVFGEALTIQLVIGIVLILSAVLLIVLGIQNTARIYSLFIKKEHSLRII